MNTNQAVWEWPVWSLLFFIRNMKLKCISNVSGAGGIFEQIAVQTVCAWVDKTYIYWWRERYKSFIGVHQSIIDTLTDSQLEGFGGQSFSLLPRGKSEGHRLQPRWNRKMPPGLGWSWEEKGERKRGKRKCERETVRKCVLSGVSISAVLVFLVPRKRINSRKREERMWKNGNRVHTGGQEGHAFTVH